LGNISHHEHICAGESPAPVYSYYLALGFLGHGAFDYTILAFNDDGIKILWDHFLRTGYGWDRCCKSSSMGRERIRSGSEVIHGIVFDTEVFWTD
jgi:hypothetical protein